MNPLYPEVSIFLKIKERLILRKICAEGPTFYALKKLCHPKINRIL
jgi:hypothetical protein